MTTEKTIKEGSFLSPDYTKFILFISFIHIFQNFLIVLNSNLLIFILININLDFQIVDFIVDLIFC